MGLDRNVSMVRNYILSIVVSGALLTSGCAALVVGAAAGAGSVAYLKGELKSVEKGTVERGYQATLNVLDRMGMFVTKKTRDKQKGMVVARRADDTKITIHLKRIGEEVIEIRVRVGILGNEESSRQILEEIQKRF